MKSLHIAGALVLLAVAAPAAAQTSGTITLRVPAAGDACQGFSFTQESSSVFGSGYWIVSSVGAGSPADAAGVREGDQLTHRNDVAVNSDAPINGGPPAPGDTIRFRALRDGGQVTLTMVVGALRPSASGRLECGPARQTQR